MRVLLKSRSEFFVDDGLHQTLDLGVAKLGLCLSLKLGIPNLHRQHTDQSFSGVVSRDALAFCGFEKFVLLSVRVDGSSQSRLEAREVCSTFKRVDVVGKGQHGL